MCHYCFQLSFIHIHFVWWAGRILNMQMETVFVNRTFVAAIAKLTSFRDVGSSFSYIAPTDCVQVNF